MPVDDTSSRWPGIDPGKLRIPITILGLTAISPPVFDAGGIQMSWNPVATAMAMLEITKATDLIRSGQDVTKTWVSLTIRYQPGIQSQMRVQLPDYTTNPPGTLTYEIQAVENVQHRRVLLKLTCIALGSNY